MKPLCLRLLDQDWKGFALLGCNAAFTTQRFLSWTGLAIRRRNEIRLTGRAIACWHQKITKCPFLIKAGYDDHKRLPDLPGIKHHGAPNSLVLNPNFLTPRR